MVIDTSALVAILQKEPERRPFIEAIEAADSRLMAVATFVEISIVIEARHGAIWITSSAEQPSSSCP
jgi:ribonuclease VapC